MAIFTGTGSADTADATTGTLIGFTGGSVAELQDDIGDFFNGLADNDTIIAGAGMDFAVYSDATGSVTIDLAAGTASGPGVGADTLRSIEAIRGSNFADTYTAIGFSGSSTNAGSNGTSNSFQGLGGDDSITGNGNTQVQYTLATGGVTVDLAAGTASGDGSVGSDTFSGVIAVTGSNFNDVLSGTTANDRFDGRAGNDLIDGRGGRIDQVRYGDDPAVTAGINVLLAAGTVTGDASIGTDTLRSIEFVSGTGFADFFDATGFGASSANAGSDGTWNQFDGRGGNDVIIGNGNTQLSYASATAGVEVNIALGAASGNASVGNDTFSGVTSVVGSNFADTLLGSDTGFGPGAIAEIFQSGAGDDLIDGRGGFDEVMYGAGSTVATSGISILLAAGTVTGNSSVGIDTLRSIEAVIGTNFDDVFDATGFSAFSTNAGNAGDNGMFNHFQGLGGNDTIVGNGDTGINYSFAMAGVSIDFVTGIAVGGGSVGTDTFSGVARAGGSSFDDTMIGNENAQEMSGFAGYDNLYGGGGNDTLEGGINEDVVVGDAGNDTLNGGDGNDVISELFDSSGSGNDTIDGGNGIDIIYAEAGDDSVSGGIDAANNFASLGTGNDSYTGGIAVDVVVAATGNDTINGNAGTDSLFGEEGNDAISGGADLDVLSGAAGNDTLDGGDGPDLLVGDQGNDVLRGGAGLDVMYGYADNDTLNGGADIDALYGGDGNDTFQVGAAGYGFDYVWDFQSVPTFLLGDVLIFSSAVFADTAAVLLASSYSGGNSYITAGGTTTVLVAVNINTLVQGDDYTVGAF